VRPPGEGLTAFALVGLAGVLNPTAAAGAAALSGAQVLWIVAAAIARG
jgi:hypothetical protein